MADAAIYTLTDDPYQQTFDSLGTASGAAALPLGWDVRTGATATSLGTPALSVAKQTWGDNTKGFLNVAAATGLSSTASPTLQNNSLNRSLGMRQAGDFGDPGASFAFQFSSLGHTLTAGSVDMVLLSSQGRSTTWLLQYGLGESPSSFTTIATWADPGVFGTTTLSFDAASLAGMSNQSRVWFRAATLAPTTGSASRDTVGIDNFTLIHLPEPSALGLAAVACVVVLLASRPTMRRHRRAGFSLVEVLVVIAIIGLLVGMLLPAVQAARESARRSLCTNNLRQLTTSLLAFESMQGRFPAAARVSDQDACTACFDPWGEARRTAVSPGDDKHGTSWVLEVLPHLDHMSLFSNWDRSTNVAGNAALAATDIPCLYCPTRRGGIRTGSSDHDRLPFATWRGGGTDYGGCMGRVQGFRTSADDTIDGRHRFAGTDMVLHGNGPKDGVFQPDASLAAAAIHDGLTHTILTGELQRLRPPATGSVIERGRRTSQDGWAVGGAATLFVTATGNANNNPGGINNFFYESPGSDHAGGAVFGMADGSVHFVTEFIDARDNNAVFPLLGSMRDRRPVSLAEAGL